jgi:hypothetical protein
MSPRAVACSVHQRAQICTDAVWYGMVPVPFTFGGHRKRWIFYALSCVVVPVVHSHHNSTNIKRPQQNINIKKATSLNLNRGI